MQLCTSDSLKLDNSNKHINGAIDIFINPSIIEFHIDIFYYYYISILIVHLTFQIPEYHQGHIKDLFSLSTLYI